RVAPSRPPPFRGRAATHPSPSQLALRISALQCPTGPMRLLIAEDDEKLSAALARGLRGEGYAVDVAGTGEDALLQARVYDYDVVILDVMIPEPDGVAVCRTLREEQRWAPVLMLTARDGVNDRILGLDAGADD